MKIASTKIHNLLEQKGLSQNKLAQLTDCNRGSFSLMIHGKKPFPNDIILKMAITLDVSPEEIKGWILADKYPKNILEMAIRVKQEIPQEEGKLILTAKIDEILQQKRISRTALSKLIDYSQGKLNEMIISKEPISSLVITKIAPVLEVSEDEIASWIVADKYSLEALNWSAR